MLKRPGPAPNFGNSPTRTPTGQAGPHRYLGVGKGQEIIPLPRREPERGARRPVRGSGGAAKGRCGSGGSSRAARLRGQRRRGRAPGGEGAVRGHVRGRAPWEWSRGAGGAGGGGAAAARGRRAPRAPGGCCAAAGGREGGSRCSQSLGASDFRALGHGGAEPGRGESRAAPLAPSPSSFRSGGGWGWCGRRREGFERPRPGVKFTCVSRQRGGLGGSGGELSLRAQWAVR